MRQDRQVDTRRINYTANIIIIIIIIIIVVVFIIIIVVVSTAVAVKTTSLTCCKFKTSYKETVTDHVERRNIERSGSSDVYFNPVSGRSIAISVSVCLFVCLFVHSSRQRDRATRQLRQVSWNLVNYRIDVRKITRKGLQQVNDLEGHSRSL